MFFALPHSPIWCPAFFIEPYGVNLGILLPENQNVLHEMSVSSLFFSPPLPMMPAVLCFCFVFYLFRSRSRMFFALPPSPIESYSVNLGMYNYCSCCLLPYILNIICIQIEYKQSKRKGKNKSVALTHNTPA